MSYRIGIDAGSKTLKLVVLDEQDRVVYSSYRRHRAEIRRTLEEALHDLIWHIGDIEGTVTITGSAGMGIAEVLNIPFVQEVIATTYAVQAIYPDADAVIELGGEDAKVVYLTDGLEQRMNATCAGGTGGFIDTIAFMLGAHTSDMSRLAHGARCIYPIASRCAVFAQTDVRALLNTGTSKSDIAASTLNAVVRQVLGGLVCGRPIRGKVIFLGGPLEHIPYLVNTFRNALGIDSKSGIKPKDAHLFTARGAAMLSERPSEKGAIPNSGRTDGLDGTSLYQMSLLEQRLDEMQALEDDLGHLEPLFEDNRELEAFRERHSTCSLTHKRLFDARGPLYLGIDAGSTAVKLAVLDQGLNLVYSAYEPTGGDMIKTLRTMLLEFFSFAPKPYQSQELRDNPYVWIEHATATGYGEDLVRAAFGADSGIVETAAHLRAAQHICPQVSFVLDIGGQDMKALWVHNGHVSDAVLNEACSSGCGAFIEGTAHTLNATPQSFAEAALHAKAPVDLGTKCTVFMTSRVRHAQKIGADFNDIAAGAAYSVVQNALYRIIGAERVATMGDNIVVQGGTFKSDSILRAFELISGKEVIRCEEAHLMGAVGAALTAAERASEGNKAQDTHQSSFVTREELVALSPTRRTLPCTGCENSCMLSVIEFGEGRAFISENKCERGLDELKRVRARLGAEEQEANSRGSSPPDDIAGSRQNSAQGAGTIVVEENPGKPSAQDDVEKTGNHGRTLQKPPNMIALEQHLIRSCVNKTSSETRHADDENHPTTEHLGSRCETDISQNSCSNGEMGAGKRERGATVGLMNTLNLFEYTPFWFSLLSELGFNIVVPTSGCELVHGDAVWETVPSESVCYPAKISHARYFDLCSHDVDAVFMPCFERNGRCPVSYGYAQALKDNVGADMTPIVSPLLASCKPEQIAQDETSCLELLDALADAAEAGSKASYVEETLQRDGLSCAMQKALQAQQSFQRKLERSTRETLDWIHMSPDHHGILVFGRPYHVDVTLMHGIDSELQKLGFAVLGVAGLADELDQEDIAAYEKTYPWEPAKYLLEATSYVLHDPQIDLVCLQSFGCGFDAMSLEGARRVLDRAGRPFTMLKIDDISDMAHVRIRLRTLAEAIESRRRSERIQQQLHVPGSSSPTPEKSTSDAAEALSHETSCSLLSEPLDASDLETARRDTSSDICFTARIMAARAIRLVRERPGLSSITLPKVCKDCLVDGVGCMVERTTGSAPKLIWEKIWNGDKTRCGTEEKPNCTGDGPRIGIVGNALLCFEPFMNDEIVDKIGQLGCQPVLPQPELLAVEDVRYIAQLSAFDEEDVRDIVYLQSFGCLKGHISSRGALHELKRIFPHMRITVIDFDPEASALNRESRLRLAIEAAKQDHASRPVVGSTR